MQRREMILAALSAPLAALIPGLGWAADEETTEPEGKWVSVLDLLIVGWQGEDGQVRYKPWSCPPGEGDSVSQGMIGQKFTVKDTDGSYISETVNEAHHVAVVMVNVADVVRDQSVLNLQVAIDFLDGEKPWLVPGYVQGESAQPWNVTLQWGDGP